MGGKGRYARGYFGSDSVRSTDLFFLIIVGNTNPYPAQPATGVLGQRPKRILPTFVRTKVGPRRVGVPALHPAKSMPRRQATTNSAQKFFCILFFTEKTPTGQALQFMPLQKGRTAPAVKDTK